MFKEIDAKHILFKSKNPSDWFGVDYYINIYRGYMHACIYCDTRSDCYQVENFDEDIYIKKNAIDLLRKELSSKKQKGTIGFGSMSDAYVPIERKYQLTRAAIEVIKEFKYSVFILTKSDLIIRDLDLLTDINNESYACVAFTITTYLDDVARKIEPNAPLPSERFKAMRVLADSGIKVGVMMWPILSFVLDNEHNIKTTMEKAKEHGASFIIPCFGVTLRDKQRDYYYKKLDEHFIGTKDKYIKKYKNNYFCPINNEAKIKEIFNNVANENNLSVEMPVYKHNKNGCTQLSIFDII